jgi:hypothetical protein
LQQNKNNIQLQRNNIIIMAPTKRKSQEGGEGTRKRRTSPRTSGEAKPSSTAASAAADGDKPPAPRRSSRRRGAPPPPAAAPAAAAEEEEDSDWKKLTKKEARREILQMLQEHNMDHLYYLDCRQLTELAKILVQHHNPHRKKDIQRLIDNHRQAYEQQQEESSSSCPEEAEGSADSADGESSHVALHELHDVELNELSCTLDYLFKIKAAIIQAETLLQEGKATAQTRKDDWMPVPIDGKKTSYSGFRTDIYVWAPETLKYEICQGTFINYFI